jgi:DNA-binding CsgD family transcriptional regulator
MAREALSPDVIADIFEAAVDEERWSGIANIVAAAVGVPVAGVFFVDQGQVLDLSFTKEGAESQTPYLAHYFKYDVWQKGHMRTPWNRVHLGGELFPERELVKTEFYNDFARSFGMFRPMGAIMQLARGTFATVSVNRPPGSRLLEESDKGRLERLLPYMRRAFQLRHAHRKHAARTVRESTLDALTFGIVVCEAGGRIVFANAAAEALAQAGAGLVLGSSGKGLGALLPVEGRTLAALINDAGSGGSGGAMRLSGRNGGTDLVVLVTPLPRSLAVDSSAGTTRVLVTLRSARDSPSFTAEILIHLFGVSPAQAEIALAIYNGKTPEQIAAERGVAISTVRTHLTEIFVRTGAENQRDLVRLLGMLPPVRATRP